MLWGCWALLAPLVGYEIRIFSWPCLRQACLECEASIWSGGKTKIQGGFLSLVLVFYLCLSEVSLLRIWTPAFLKRGKPKYFMCWYSSLQAAARIATASCFVFGLWRIECFIFFCKDFPLISLEKNCQTCYCELGHMGPAALQEEGDRCWVIRCQQLACPFIKNKKKIDW